MKINGIEIQNKRFIDYDTDVRIVGVGLEQIYTELFIIYNFTILGNSTTFRMYDPSGHALYGDLYFTDDATLTILDKLWIIGDRYQNGLQEGTITINGILKIG
jgi:hypothetical protein